MTDESDITDRLEDTRYDGAIYMRIEAAKEIRALRQHVARLERLLAETEVKYEKLGDHSYKQALDIVTLGQEVGRLREALELGVKMRAAQGVYFADRSRDNLIASKQAEREFDVSARAALAEQEK